MSRSYCKLKFIPKPCKFGKTTTPVKAPRLPSGLVEHVGLLSAKFIILVSNTAHELTESGSFGTLHLKGAVDSKATSALVGSVLSDAECNSEVLPLPEECCSNEFVPDAACCSQSETSEGEQEQNVLTLSFEEAIFLMYGLNCLKVKHSSNATMYLSVEQVWKHAMESSSNFLHKYVVYHYYRSIGWVVRSGLSYGVDYVTYKESLMHYHSTCGILITSNNLPISRNWSSLLCVCRNLKHVCKALIICDVKRKQNVADDVLCPKCISAFGIKELCMDSWFQENSACRD